MTASFDPIASGASRPPRWAWATLLRTEARLVARDTAGLLLPIGVPVLFMVMNGLGSDGAPQPWLDGMTVMDAIAVPGTLVMIVAMFGLINVPSWLATHRQYGVLRRLSTTPARPAMVLVAQVAVNAALGAIGIALALGIAVGGFGISGPRNVGGAVASLLLGACALYGAGLIVAAVAPTPNAALAVGLVVFFGTMAAGGGMLPAEGLPPVVARIGELLPFGATLHPLRASWVGDSPSWLHLGVLAVTSIVSLPVAARAFRWR